MLASFGWLQSTVVPYFDQQLRDFYLSIAVDSRSDQAPGLLHLTFDNEALAAHGLPDRVPATAIKNSLETGRSSRQAIILDVDLATRSDLKELEPLLLHLEEWGQDPEAALLLLAHPQYQVSYRDRPAYLRVDSIVRTSPNIAWAAVSAFGDVDGIIRSYEYWSCDDVPAMTKVLPSAALYTWVHHETGSAAETIAQVKALFATSRDVCGGSTVPAIQLGAESFAIPRQGLIEYQTSIDALDADADKGQYARDGLPRLMTIGYCSINPASCGRSGEATQLATIAKDRIVLISASNDFSRDDHLTPVGIMAGSVILGNAARALINSGPPIPAAIIWQLVVLVSSIAVIWLVWIGMGRMRTWIRSCQKMPMLCKCGYAITNPVVMQWVAFGLADVMILFYYHFFFSSSDWGGLVVAGFGVTSVSAALAFRDWAAAARKQNKRGD
jgi:hypothetical protein